MVSDIDALVGQTVKFLIFIFQRFTSGGFDFPDEHVRSVFLVGVATPNIKQPLLFPRSAQHAMDLLFADCVRGTREALH